MTRLQQACSEKQCAARGICEIDYLCSVENFYKMSLRGPKGRGNLLRGRQKETIVAFEIAYPSTHSATLRASFCSLRAKGFFRSQ